MNLKPICICVIALALPPAYAQAPSTTCNQTAAYWITPAHRHRAIFGAKLKAILVIPKDKDHPGAILLSGHEWIGIRAGQAGAMKSFDNQRDARHWVEAGLELEAR